MITRRLATLFLAAIAFLSLSRVDTTSAGAGRDFINPLIFVRDDGVYIFDSLATKPDPVIRGKNATYSRARWSADGSQFVFSEYTQTETGASILRLLHVGNGDSPEPLLTFADDPLLPPYTRLLPTAWLPDGERVAFVNTAGISALSLQAGEPELIFPIDFGGGIGEPGNEGDLAAWAYYDEREISLYSTTQYLETTATGLLVGYGDPFYSLWKLVSPDGKQLADYSFASKPLLSPDGRKALVRLTYLKGYDDYPLVVLDLETQQTLVLPLTRDAEPLGWSADGEEIYYGTQESVMVLEGDPNAPLGIENYGFGWPYTAHEYALTLWRLPLDATDESQAVKEFESRGFGFGVLAVGEPGKPLVFSVVSSSVAMIQAINDGASAEAVYAAAPHVDLYAVYPDSGYLAWTMPGGKPVYGKGTFMAVVSD